MGQVFGVLALYLTLGWLTMFLYDEVRRMSGERGAGRGLDLGVVQQSFVSTSAAQFVHQGLAYRRAPS